ncbi:hypothetical protein EK21DRAFT_100352 [Setomelanomma holmii]|uniref:Uncharacterized protein n=1 Tax=Setomelanomma holmii TaxID=210430 RepID=A0A9P4LKS7_9PLEO|nr:hypothetical protein EK21DRAFT_100352 [Setomelanomma holmii]
MWDKPNTVGGISSVFWCTLGSTSSMLFALYSPVFQQTTTGQEVKDLAPHCRAAPCFNADDDWTGLTDAAARRKRQNRLNVRAYRNRPAQAQTSPFAPHWVEKEQAIVNLPRRQMRPQEALLPMSEPATTSIASAVFPLSSDHLIVLVQFNVLRGSLMNRQLLDHTLKVAFDEPPTTIPTDTHVFPRRTAHALHTLPLTLCPTQLQCTVPHPHWVDIIPHPQMRDNIINAIGGFDAEVLWLETVGRLFLGFGEEASAEAKGPFVKSFVGKWGWALKGCDEVLEATNRWRELRGEERIVAQPEDT